MRILTFIAGLLTLVRSAEEDVAVVTLTVETFDSFLEKEPIALVEFYAPWCGHCKRLAPEYEAAAKRLKDSVPLAQVDATVEGEVAQRFSVRGYPTIKLFRNGVPEDYSGGRTADTIVSWVEAMTSPPVTIVDSKDAAKEFVASESQSIIIGEFTSKDSPQFEVFEKVGDANRSGTKFVAYFGNDAKNTATIYRNGEGGETSEVQGLENFQTWFNNEKFPHFGKIDGDNYAQYMSRDQELVWFAGSQEDFETASPAVRAVAKELRGEYSFVWLDTEKFKSHADQTLGITEFPGLAVQKKTGRFLFPSSDFKNQEAVKKFFDDIASGKITRSLKSEPIPETNDEAVKVVVGETFDDIVLQEDKDCFLEVYAPWCGHCKKLEPIYTEFAEMLKNSEHVVVAKMDGTANESPSPNFEWQGFPTLFFVKAGTEEPIMFDGDRTVNGLVEFVKAHSSKPIDVSASVEKDEL